MDNSKKIEEYFTKHVLLVARVQSELGPNIEMTASAAIKTLESGGTIFLCGNGGSAADAQHIATEFTGRFIRQRRALKAIALTTDSSALTAVGNDFGFEKIFSRQLEALASPDDLLFAISTSGNSPNIIEAIKTAQRIGCKTIGFLGNDGGEAQALVDIELVVSSDYTPHIQEMHICIGHLICELADSHFA